MAVVTAVRKGIAVLGEEVERLALSGGASLRRGTSLLERCEDSFLDGCGVGDLLRTERPRSLDDGVLEDDFKGGVSDMLKQTGNS